MVSVLLPSDEIANIVARGAVAARRRLLIDERDERFWQDYFHITMLSEA
jgi:hypothetical protein